MIQSVEDYHEGTQVFNTVKVVFEAQHGTKRSVIREKDTIYIVDLFGQRGIESRARYDNFDSAKRIAEDWVFDR